MAHRFAFEEFKPGQAALLWKMKCAAKKSQFFYSLLKKTVVLGPTRLNIMTRMSRKTGVRQRCHVHSTEFPGIWHADHDSDSGLVGSRRRRPGSGDSAAALVCGLAGLVTVPAWPRQRRHSLSDRRMCHLLVLQVRVIASCPPGFSVCR